MDDRHQQRLGAWLCERAEAERVEIGELRRLSGGAIQENWQLDVTVVGGAFAGSQRWVLRRDSDSRLDVSHSRAREFALLQLAFAHGLRVPEPLFVCEDEQTLERPFYVMRWVAGVTHGPTLVREPANPALVRELGRQLARLHNLRPPIEALPFLVAPEQPPALSRIAQYRGYLDGLPQPHPVWEYGLRWLERHAPTQTDVCLCHGDFRTGNLAIDHSELCGILDWEFASFSDPYEDLGWLCARCWRFGEWDREAGGLGSRADLYAGYEEVSGVGVDTQRVRYWEIMGTVRWGIVAHQQAERCLGGGERSLVLALTGRMPPEMALDLLDQLEVAA